MTSPRSLIRALRSVRDTVTRRAAAAPTAARRLELDLDGASLLNWRLLDGADGEMRLVEVEGADVVQCPARPGHPVPHGVLPLSRLRGERYRVEVSTDGVWGAPEDRWAQRQGGTLDEARLEDGSLWSVHGGGLLVRTPASERPPAVEALGAAWGEIEIAVAPVREGSALVLVRRGDRTIVEVPAEPGSATERRSTFRAGADVWDRLVADGEEGTSTWNVHCAAPDGAGPGARLTWGGSALAAPREALRFGTVEHPREAGGTVRVRPYWTLDHHLALEVRLDRPDVTDQEIPA